MNFCSSFRTFLCILLFRVSLHTKISVLWPMYYNETRNSRQWMQVTVNGNVSMYSQFQTAQAITLTLKSYLLSF